MKQKYIEVTTNLFFSISHTIALFIFSWCCIQLNYTLIFRRLILPFIPCPVHVSSSFFFFFLLLFFFLFSSTIAFIVLICMALPVYYYIYVTIATVSIPPGMVQDQFGMIGLLTFIRGAETDPGLVALALGRWGITSEQMDFLFQHLFCDCCSLLLLLLLLFLFCFLYCFLAKNEQLH